MDPQLRQIWKQHYSDMTEQDFLTAWKAKHGEQQQQQGVTTPEGQVVQAQAGGGGETYEPMKSVKNLPRSAGELVKSYVQPIIHPVETAKAMGKLGKGAFQHAIGTEGDTPEKQAASAAKQWLIDRYGSWDAVIRTMEEDPAGFLADASTILTLGGSAVARAPGVIGKMGQVVKQAGRKVDPMALPATALNKTLKYAGATQSGTGTRALDVARESGESVRMSPKSGKTVYQESMRGNMPDSFPLDKAKAAIDKMREERHATYLKNMAAARGNNTQIDFGPITRAQRAQKRAEQLQGNLGMKFKTDEAGQRAIAKIEDLIHMWGNDQALHTVEGLDALKQRLQSLQQQTKRGTDEHRYYTHMANEVKKHIIAVEPSYAQAMKEFEEAKALSDEITDTLSIGRDKLPDQTTRKLLSVMRNNSQTNYGRRKKLVDVLEGIEPGLEEYLGGQMSNSWQPRGVGGNVAGALAPSGWAGFSAVAQDPRLLLGLPAQLMMMSPRALGEASFYLGKYGPRREVLSNLLFQSGRDTTAPLIGAR
jgi:hypothetical protein